MFVSTIRLTHNLHVSTIWVRPFFSVKFLVCLNRPQWLSVTLTEKRKFIIFKQKHFYRIFDSLVRFLLLVILQPALL